MTGMSNGLLPTWLAATWGSVFVVVLAVHLRHALSMVGLQRAWHGTHLLMAIGMIDMFWPWGAMPVGESVGVVVFIIATVAAVLVTVQQAVRSGRYGLWTLAAVDLASMAYMFAMLTTRIAAVSVVLVAWFLLEAAGWFHGISLGLLPRHALAEEERADQAADAAGSDLNHRAASARCETPNRLQEAGAVQTLEARAHQADRSHLRDLRVTLGLMSLGMAYMLVSMQFGM